MNERREAEFRRLMAWYPAVWRAEWEEVVIGSLLDDADRRGLDAVPAAEAWSLRGHGLVERITAARASLATAALVAAVAGSASLFLIAPAPQVAAVLPVLSTLVGPVLLAAVVAAMAYRGGLLTVRGVGASLLLGTVALVGAYLARWSWSVGFDEADAGRPQSWLATAFLPLLVTSWLLGTAAFLPLLLGTFRDLHHRPLRYVLATVAAAAAAVAVGVGLIAPASCALVAAVLTVVAVRQQPASKTEPSTTPVDRPSRRRWPLSLRLGLAALTLVGSSIAAAFALTGSSWPGYPGNGTDAMNAGLGAAALSTVPLLLVGGEALRTRPRYRSSPAPTIAIAAAAATTAAQWSGADSAWQWPLLLIAAALAGLSVGTLTTPALPVRGFPRVALTIALSAAAAGTIGIPTATIGPFTTPLIALLAIVQTLRRPRRVAPQPAAPQPLGTV